MRFSLYCLTFYFELNNHKTDTQNKSCKKKFHRRNNYEGPMIWFAFKTWIRVNRLPNNPAVFSTILLDMSLRPNRKLANGQRSTLIKYMTSTNYKLEPAIWPRGTGQRIIWFDRCQLIVTSCDISKKVQGKPMLHVSVNLLVTVIGPSGVQFVMVIGLSGVQFGL